MRQFLVGMRCARDSQLEKHTKRSVLEGLERILALRRSYQETICRFQKVARVKESRRRFGFSCRANSVCGGAAVPQHVLYSSASDPWAKWLLILLCLFQKGKSPFFKSRYCPNLSVQFRRPLRSQYNRFCLRVHPFSLETAVSPLLQVFGWFKKKMRFKVFVRASHNVSIPFD